MKTPSDSEGAVTRRSLEGGEGEPTDFARWRKVVQETPSWDERNQLIASLIPPGSSVLDIGAGAMTLSRYLARDTHYTPMDTVAASQQTVAVDFNACQIPELSWSYDFAVCSGVLEYILPVHLFLDTVARWAHTIILSYATSDLTPGATARRRNGWLNHLSDAELRRLFVAHGLRLKSTIPWERQLIYILDTSNVSRFIYYSPETVQNRADIVSVFRYDPANVGDFFGAPFRYLNFGSLRCVDILGLDESLSLPPNLIVGGGGLLGSSTFDPWFRKLFDRSHEQVVGWGLGDNSRIDVHSGYVQPGKYLYPDYVKQFTLLGVRDSGTAHPWVPCASCLHPLFAQKWEIKNEVVVLEHKRVPIRIEGFPKMNNDTHDLSRIVRFLGTARVVITNSYHGAYWSQLLGKGVLAFPFSSKFYSLKHKVTLCKPAEWKRYLERVEEQPPALRECIQANLDFERKVRALLGLPQPAPAAGSRCEERDPRKPMPNLKTRITGTSATTRASQSPASAPILVKGRTQIEHAPSMPACKEVCLEAPPFGEALDRFLDSLRPGDVVVVPDSEDARFDALKLRLFEFEHDGRDPHTKKQTWRGAKEQRPSCPPLRAHHTPPTVISFYTVDTPYAELAKRLQASCEQLGLPNRIEGIPSHGSWEFNCAFKPRFILAKWRELKTPILWVDADAVVRRFPALLAGVDADFAIHKVERWQFASGTVFFNQTENALRLLEDWVRHCDAKPGLWDQEHLDAAWEEVADRFPLKTLWLPQSYTRIFDRAVLPGEDPLPVIEHFQASRELKQTTSNRPPTPAREFPRDFVAARSVSRSLPNPSNHAPPRTREIPEITGTRTFIEQLALLFNSRTVLQLDWISSQKVRATPFQPGADIPEPGSMDFEGAHLHLPFEDNAFATAFNLATLNRLDDAALPQALAEIRRVTNKNVWVALEASANRDKQWWERQFFEAGFRKHPFSQRIVPFEALEQEANPLTMLFEKIPQPALDRYPLATLKTERDLHMDMLRESGRRSDAHIARYTLAREFLPREGIVLDAACGLGYGSAFLAQAAGPAVRVIGLDNSQFAVDYARVNFSPYLPNLEFCQHDVRDLSWFSDASADLVVSFETVEHLSEPAVFLREVRRVLKPSGRFLCSVPNLWVDENGKDPNPWHFHVYDLAKLMALTQEFFDIEAAYAQTAGGGMKLPNAPRRLRQVQLPVTSGEDQAEWWLVAGTPRPQPSPKVTASSDSPGILILNQDPAHPLYSSWLSGCRHPVQVIQGAASDLVFPAETGIFVTAETYHHPNPTLIRRAVEQRIPTLVLADGILEYRNVFEHPDLVPGAIFQPVLGHKIACLGRSQARFLESWGNTGKCEIVGAPRFDRYHGLRRRTRSADEPFRVLVMTAVTPYFTEAQHDVVREALLSLKRFHEANPRHGGLELQPIWRLTQGLADEIGVASSVNDLSGLELAEVLQQVDAVITTPSTAMLEGMLLGLPVAALDFFNVPLYVQPAWRLTAETHIPTVMVELIQPPAPKMLFQETTLHDALECTTPAAPRMVELVETMIELGVRARSEKRALALPAQILRHVDTSEAMRENRFQLAELFPNTAVFKEDRVAALQVELAQLRDQVARHERGAMGSNTGPQIVSLEAAGHAKFELPGSGSSGLPSHSDSHSTFDFIEQFNHAVLGRGEASQAAIWDSFLEGKAARAICLHPPAELIFRIPTGKSGCFTTAVAIHPDAWDKPGAGGCEFRVRADERPVAAIALDPTHQPSDRRWHEVRIDLPETATQSHQIVLETKSLGSTADFRWALWRAPAFISDTSTSSRAKPRTPQPTMTILERPTSNQALIEQANAAFDGGNVAAAKEFLSAALQQTPDNGELALALGHTKLSLGDLPGALADYTTAAERLPASAAAHSSRALALQLLQKSREAESVALCALILDPDDLVALKVLARICLNAGRHADAQVHCRRILAIDPRDADALKMQEENALAQPSLRSDSPGSSVPTAQIRPPPPGPAVATPAAAPSEKVLYNLQGDYTARSRAWQSFGVEHLLHQLVVGNYQQPLAIMEQPATAPTGIDGLPIPPADLTMGYGAGNLDHYLASGRRSYQVLTQLLQDHNLTLDKGDAMLDWGCAAGRTTRNFLAEAGRGCEVWGCDVHTASIQWAQDHLSPPFRFFNSSSLPHLPFPDGTFKFIYGLSVVTHLIAMRDLWLLELRRVLRRDGCLFLSVHDENTWTWFREHGMPAWIPSSLHGPPNLPGECLEIRGNRWEYCYTFFHSDYIRRIWGQFFHIAEIKPRADSYQAIVVLKSK